MKTKDDPFLRVAEIARRVGRHRSSLYYDIKRGVFPPFVKMGGASAGMLQSELHRVQALRLGNPSDAELSALVRKIVREREACARAVRAEMKGD